MHGVNVTLVVMDKLVALGMVMLCKLRGLAVTVTLGEKANQSSVVEGMAIQGVNVTLLVRFKLSALGMTLGEKANESSVLKGMVI